MDWLLHHAERYRCHIQSGPFFTRLAHAERPIDLFWVHQLLHQSREFTQALCLRYSLCRDKRFQSAFAEHAFEEADHPDQLVAWMDKHGFLEGGEPGSVAATQDTINALAFCWRSAVYEPPDMQIVVLNVLSEGVALDFFAAVIPVLAELDLLSRHYWKAHRDIDGRHLKLGLDRCYEVDPESPTGQRYQHVLWHAANLYHQMLSSWVGERVEQLAPMWTDNLQGRLLLPRARRAVAAVQNTNS